MKKIPDQLDGERPSQDKAARVRAALDAALTKAGEDWDAYLRELPGRDNVPRHAPHDVEMTRKYDAEPLVNELLEVCGNLARRLELAREQLQDTGVIADGLGQACAQTVCHRYGAPWRSHA